MATATLMTAEEFDALLQETDADLELIDGEAIEIMSANIEHNLLSSALTGHIQPRLRELSWGHIVPETLFVFGEHRYRPDLALIGAARLAKADRRRIPVRIVPNIAVEIVSPSESFTHLDRKIAGYLDHGADEVWVFVIDTRHVYVHTTEGTRRIGPRGRLTTPVVPGLEVDLDSVFAGL
jgi:Uma2 family endonuclease